MIKLKFESEGKNLFSKGYPDIVSILINEFPNGVSYNSHLHELPEILFLLDGCSEYRINHKKYTVHRGQIVVLNGQTLHSEFSTAENPVKVITCVLDHVKINGLPENHLIPDDANPVLDCEDMWDEIKDIFHEMYRENLSASEFGYEIVQLNVTKLLYLIHRRLHQETSEEPQSVSELTTMIKKYIDENYSQEITLEKLSEQFFVSPYHIVHAMKKELGLSPINYLINRRIGEAQRLLVLSDHSVNQIAEMVGYDNVNYFNRLFLKKTGYTPTKFRENGKQLNWQDWI